MTLERDTCILDGCLFITVHGLRFTDPDSLKFDGNRMIYLNFAALSPTRVEAEREVLKTLEEFKQFLYSDTGIQWYLKNSVEYRRAVAQLLHVADPSTIAFVPNASTAHHFLLSSVEWQPNDTIITSTHENPSIMREFQRLASKRVQVQTIAPTTPSEFIECFEQATRQTQVKAIVLSHVSHVDGKIFPIEAIAALARERHITLIIDGAQAVGHITVDLSQLNCAAYFFTGHKWCEGPLGTGAVVVTDQFLKLNPAFAKLAKESGKPPAALFEIGTHNIGLIAGLAKACALKLDEGLHTAELEEFRRNAKARLGKCVGIQFLEWQGPHAPGILTFRGTPDIDHGQLAKNLADNWKIIVKVFTDYPEGEAPAIRLSWSGTAPQQHVVDAIDKIADCVNPS